jgi:hypothetical protein
MVLPAMTSSAQAPSSGVFVTGPGYALGEIKAHVTEPAAAGRLRSAPSERLRGHPIDADRLQPGDFRDIQTIAARFLAPDAAPAETAGR